MRRLLLLLAAAAAFARPAAGRAQQEDAGPVNLPPFIVEEASKGPPWRYAVMPGFEILSRCTDRTTRDLAQAHFRLHQLLELLLPARLQLTFTVPKAAIFYDEALQPAASQEVIAAMLKRAPREETPVDLPVGAPGRFGLRAPVMATPSARPITFLPNLRLWDSDAMAIFAIVRDGYDSDRLVLTRDYVNYLLVNRAPALPWWFISGVLGLYDRTDYAIDALSLGPINWISDKLTTAVIKNPKTAPAPLPLAEFFSGVPPPATAENELRRKLWIAQAALFVRWALDGRTPAQSEAFWDLVDHASGGVTPEMFQLCFGIDFAAADAQLAAYLPKAVRKTVTLRPAKPLKPPAVALRNASEAELARIKGDWERLEVGLVRKQMPELADKYLEQARRTLRHAYDRDVRDPQLLAVLGLCECDAGDDQAARDFLEAAARLGPLRPRAGYELARLRFAEAGLHPEREGGRLSVTQMAAIFTPLFAARDQVPAIPEIYDLIAQVWARASVRPTRGHLDVLEDGVRLFPRRSALVYQAAVLYADYGFAEEAAKLAHIGQLGAVNAGERERFSQLETRLATAAPSPSETK